MRPASPLASIATACVAAMVLVLPAAAQDQPQQAKPPTAVPPASDPDTFVAPDTAPLVHEGVMNAPISEVWKGVSTADGYKMWGVAHCDYDLRIGGRIRSHYKPDGTLGDDGTIEQEILAYEPERMLAFRISKPPVGLPFKNAWKSTWSVITLTDLGDGRTHMRLAGMGYTDDPESQEMRKFFLAGNKWSIEKAQSHFDKSAAAPTRAPHQPNPLDPIELDVLMPAPRDEVWAIISTSAGWKRALGLDNNIELRPGGPFEIYFRPDGPEGQRGSEGCSVLSFLPGHMLSFTWNAPPEFPEARAEHTWVVIRLDDAGPGRTRLRLSHLGFAEHAAADKEGADEAQWEQVRAHFVQGWPMVVEAVRRTVALDQPGTAK